MRTTPKHALKQALVNALEQTLQVLEHSHADARAGATHPEAKPENDKDTRALEASYLARGQALRIVELRAAVAEVRAMGVDPTSGSVAVGSLVSALEHAQPVRFFLAPHGGGTKLPGDVQVVTPRSPLGTALVGKRVGDACELTAGGRERSFDITGIE
jgi:transcription elongation GreA/GreB family factor